MKPPLYAGPMGQTEKTLTALKIRRSTLCINRTSFIKLLCVRRLTPPMEKIHSRLFLKLVDLMNEFHSYVCSRDALFLQKLWKFDEVPCEAR